MQRHNADVAINNWLEKTYQNYVKNEMATPEDRVRQMFERRSLDVNKMEVKYNQDIEKLEKKLAKAQELPPSAENNQRIAYIKRDIENKLEQKDIDVSIARQTIGHDKELANEATFLGAGTRGARIQGGFPQYGMAQSEVGRGWENLADNLIGIKQAKNIGFDPNLAQRYPWLDKVDPESMIYKTQGSFNDYTSMDHVMDILRQDLRSGALSPDKLKNITVDQAIERAADFDRAAAKKMREAQIRNTEGFPTHKEYPEGYKWVQLTKPGEFNAESNAMGHSVRGYEPEKGDPDWTPESGDSGSSSYGHGGWEAIKSGKAKVYSLIDQAASRTPRLRLKSRPKPSIH